MQQHLSLTQSVAAGLRALPQTSQPFAAAQAAWRFYANDAVSLPYLAEPILDYARQISSSALKKYALVMHDFSDLNFTSHQSKADRISLYRAVDLGYFLQSALLVSDRMGEPLAPLYIGLEASDGVHSTRREKILPRRRQIDELNRTFGYIEAVGLEKPCVHIVDRQADSLLHLRRFVRCQRRFVMRSDEIRRVRFEGETLLLKEVEQSIREQIKYAREVEYQGKKAFQFITETRLVLDRLGRTQRRDARNQKRRQWVKGKPIELRSVYAEVRDEKGEILSVWRLWTNLDVTVAPETIALWYYYRWRIESFFKLLKKGGFFLEQWQQESAERVAKRLLIVAQVCVLIWALAASRDEKAKPLRQALVRLSGRLMKRKVEYTTPALLAGMWQLLAMIDALQRHTTAELEEMAEVLLEMIGSKPDY